jgi:hypothetical protein
MIKMIVKPYATVEAMVFLPILLKEHLNKLVGLWRLPC